MIGADEHIYTSYMDAMQWLEDTNVLEMIVDKFSSSVSVLSVAFLLLSFSLQMWGGHSGWVGVMFTFLDSIISYSTILVRA